MNLLHRSAIALVSLFGATAFGQLPPLPPMTNGDGNPANNGMKHVMVGYDSESQQLSVRVDDPPASPVTMTSGFGMSFDSKFDVLEDRYFNSQHGWLPTGLWLPPAGADVWIKRSSATMPDGATLAVYEGGMGPALPNWSMQPLYANDGDIWKWDLLMQHDLFVVDQPGEYSMTFEIYMGDLTTGERLDGYESASTTLRFQTPVPEPTTGAMLLMAAIGCFFCRRRATIGALAMIGLCTCASATAAFVEPMMGGGQITQGEAAMKHADISFLGGELSVVVDDTVATPKLTPLNPADQFDLDGTWGMINQHAYNFQYGWNRGDIDALPPVGSWIWIEQLDASPGLKTYQRPPASPEGQAIFSTNGSSTRWRWSGEMTHNLYAVGSPTQSTYFATYNVYIGDDLTGEPNPNFAPAQVTFEFSATPILAGDYNDDGIVNLADYTVWRDNVGQTGSGLAADGNSDEVVDKWDYELWKANHSDDGSMPASLTAQVPEPMSIALAIYVAAALWWRRRSDSEE